MHRTLISAAVLALAGLAAAPAPAAVHPAAAQVTTQLPRSASPTHYDVSLVPDAGKASFAGKVTITLNVLEPTSKLTLNAADMQFSKVSLAPVSGKGASLEGKARVDNEAQTATFDFGQTIARGAYKLTLEYTGKIGTQAYGLFAIDYDTPAGKKRALYTQFENSDARRMIPSWDEPNYKATFTLDAVVPAGQMAVSNMPAASTKTLPDGRQHVQFARTPKMSTYLLFFGAGEFDRLADKSGSTEVGVVTKKGSAQQARFVLDASKDILREYNDYFGVKYPLPKLDNVAAPGRSQFFGAMENWGAIFTFEYVLLLDPAISTAADKQAAFAVAAHEMAHQWFGDLVTMQWWDDLWLNEGFASWMESRMTAKLHPEWQTSVGTVNVRESAMQRDSVSTTHPIVQHVSTVEQASQAFDDITYAKGESVIRMLENYVGEDAWRNGVRAYMKQHAYSNTQSDDLWKQIEKAAKKPVTAIAHDFTLQPGVPLIRVQDVACKNGHTLATLEQGEFSRDLPGKKPLAWRVPVVAKVLGQAQAGRTLVSNGKGTIDVPGCGPLVVNHGQAGYYRTLYSPATFGALAKDFANIEPVDQLGMLSDAWAFAINGDRPASDFLDLANAVPANAAPQVWSKIAAVMGSIHTYYKGDTARQQKFDAWALKRLAPVFVQVGWTPRQGEPEPIANLRMQLIDKLSDLNDAGVIAEARRLYAASATNADAIPGPLRKSVLAVVAQHADAATWDKLHAQAKAEKSPLIKDNLYAMLALAEDPALARRALDLALTDEPGVTNSASMIAIVANSHPEMAFDFALANMAKVNERVDASSRSRYFPRLADASMDPAMIAKVNQYAQQHLAPTSRRDAETAAADIAYRVKIRNERLPAIDTWLNGK
ncbi:MAG: M1 family metallopeptidase [Telluria sp.]